MLNFKHSQTYSNFILVPGILVYTLLLLLKTIIYYWGQWQATALPSSSSDSSY